MREKGTWARFAFVGRSCLGRMHASTDPVKQQGCRSSWLPWRAWPWSCPGPALIPAARRIPTSQRNATRRTLSVFLSLLLSPSSSSSRHPSGSGRPPAASTHDAHTQQHASKPVEQRFSRAMTAAASSSPSPSTASFAENCDALTRTGRWHTLDNATLSLPRHEVANLSAQP